MQCLHLSRVSGLSSGVSCQPGGWAPRSSLLEHHANGDVCASEVVWGSLFLVFMICKRTHATSLPTHAAVTNTLLHFQIEQHRAVVVSKVRTGHTVQWRSRVVWYAAAAFVSPPCVSAVCFCTEIVGHHLQSVNQHTSTQRACVDVEGHGWQGGWLPKLGLWGQLCHACCSQSSTHVLDWDTPA